MPEQTTTHPSISAVIVTYQSDLQALKRAVDSLRACTIPIDITLVDNDSGGSYRADLGRSFGDIRIVDSGMNKGFGAAHNLGFALRQQPSDYHLVVNPDIRVAMGNIETMIAYAEAHKDVGLLVPDIRDTQGQRQYLCKRKPSILGLFGRRFLPKPIAQICLSKVLKRYTMRDADYDSVLEPEFLSGCFMLFRSDVFKRVGGFDERFFLYFEDADITMRCRKLSRAIHFPGATVMHAWQGGARQSRKLTGIMLRSAWYFFRKWGVTWW